MDVRQSDLYAKYIRRVGWVVERVNGIQIFIKRLPLIGAVIKIQRPERMPSVKLIDQVARKYRAWRVSIEQLSTTDSSPLTSNNFKINNNPYLPTKTIRIDLIPSEDEIFRRFTEAKRRAVRRALKNNVVIKESKDVEEFIKLKSKDFWPLGWFMARDVRALWESFRLKNASILLALHPGGVHSATPGVLCSDSSGAYRPVAGVLLLFYDSIAYYWMAASTNEGKKLFVPTLLVWETLKLAKKKGCKVFDFEGIYDERFHLATKKWQGFTKFKGGFGGNVVLYPKPLIKRYW